MRPRWLRLVLEDGSYNPRVRELANGRSGAYAVRERDSHRVMYVGESSCGKLWKTMLRHFQAPDSFAKVRETGVFRRGPTHYEVAIWPTSTGNRRCTRQGEGKNEKGDQRALNAQARWIATLRPEKNKDDGQAFDAEEFRAHRARQAAEDAADPFGMLNPGSPRVVVDAAPERRAENRTPDLWTGRTKLEDRSGKARRDWKGEAERFARELAECRRAPSSPREEIPSPPALRPEGYGETDEGGQARMFRRNPARTRYRVHFSPDGAEVAIEDTTKRRLQEALVLQGVPSNGGRSAPWLLAILEGRASDAPPAFRELAPVVVEVGLTGKQTYFDVLSAKPNRHGFRELAGYANSRDVADRFAAAINGAASKKKPEGYGEEVVAGKRAGQLKLFNPRGTLTNMGALTEMQGRDLRTKRARVLRWPLSKAPTLAYDDAGRLFIVYGGRVERPTTAKESAEYRRTHWGRRGRGVVTSGGVAVPPFRRLMVAESITYTTEKGTDSAPIDYVHAWGEGARGKWLPPIVVEHECHPETCRRGSKCAAAGAVALMGGTYTVDDRGIVG